MRRQALSFISACLLLCFSTPAVATVKTWIGGSGSWNVSANWSPMGQPGLSDSVYLTQSDAVDRVVSGTTHTAAILYLWVDSTGQGSMTLDLSTGSFLEAPAEYVGYDGKGTVTQSAGTHSPTSLYLGYNASGSGTYTMTGGTLARQSGLTVYVGYAGTGTFAIQNGSQASDGDAYLGYSSGSRGTATVDGSGSNWIIAWGTQNGNASLYVGNRGIGSLDIRNAGQVSVADVFGNAHIGYDTGSDGRATVDGAGSQLTITKSLYVGEIGKGTLIVRNGGTVSSSVGRIADSSGSVGSVTVDGNGSKWANSAALYVASHGTGTMSLMNGGQVSCAGAYMGSNTGAIATVTVDGTGSTWTNTSNLNIGFGALTIQNGGDAYNTFGTIRTGGTVTVDGNGSKWTNSSPLTVDGGLAIRNGGKVSNTIGYLGYSSGDLGAVTVDGQGSLWQSTDSLYVGGTSTAAAGSGSVIVRNDGQATVSGALTLWKADSALTVNGGALCAGALAGTTGSLRITDPAGGTALTLGSASSGSFWGKISDDTGPGSLLKIGTGTQTLADAGITYTGTTTVLAGKLFLSNATSFASDIMNSATTQFDLAAGTWTFANSLGGSGAFVKSGAGLLSIIGPQDYAPGATFTVSRGTVVFQTDAGSDGANLAISVSGAELDFECDQHLDWLAITSTAKLVFAGGRVVEVNHFVSDGVDLGPATLTPEPATLTLVAFGGLALLRRSVRRHRRRG